MSTNGTNYRISARTMDLGSGKFGLITIPRGTKYNDSITKYGFVGFYPIEGSLALEGVVTGGLNEMGLSCDMQTLIGTDYPPINPNGTNIMNAYFCRWAIGNFANVSQVKSALPHITVWGTNDLSQHFVVRDANGMSIVIEFMNKQMQIYEDNNDDGKTGFGVMTNEPPFPIQVANVHHMLWKQTMARPSISIPGSWYPDERFMRAYMIKSAMPPATSYEDAVMQAVHVINSVSVPPGRQFGTDSGAGEGSGDHTLWAVIYDHAVPPTLYWRTTPNQSLQRLRLADIDISKGAVELFLPLATQLPWFNDASASFKPNKQYAMG